MACLLFKFHIFLNVNPFNCCRYTISLIHGEFTWTIKKRYKHFQSLHQQLAMFRTSLNIPFPSKTHRKKRESFKNNTPKDEKGRRKSRLPRFPKKPEILVQFEKLEDRVRQLQEYLNNLLSINIYRNHPSTVTKIQYLLLQI